MRIADYIGQACGNLWKKKLRTFLTTSGVVIGIGALVSMFAFGQGIQRNVTEQFNKLDLFNYINVYARGSLRQPRHHHDPDDEGWRAEGERSCRRECATAGQRIPGGGEEDRRGGDCVSGVAFSGPDSPGGQGTIDAGPGLVGGHLPLGTDVVACGAMLRCE